MAELTSISKWYSDHVAEQNERFQAEQEARAQWILKDKHDRRRSHLLKIFYQRYRNTWRGKIDFATRPLCKSVRETWNNLRWRLIEFIGKDLLDD